LSSGADNSIHQLDRDGKSHVWRKGAGTNGLLFDRKGQLVACDSEGRRMVRIDPDSGKLTVLTDRFDGKRYNTPNDLTIDAQGRGPDGVKQDPKGRLYVAAGLNKPNPPAEPADDVKGGIYVLSPEGKLLTFLAVPKDEVTNCAFGGDDLKTLYITGGGTLYSIRMTTPGRVVYPPAQ